MTGRLRLLGRLRSLHEISGGAAGFEAGTVMPFYQDAAPTGWTKDVATTLDNSALRIVTSTAWATGKQGATAFDSVFGSSKVAGDTTLSAAQSGSPAHKHGGGSYSAASGGAHGHDNDLAPGGDESTFNTGEHLGLQATIWDSGVSQTSDIGIVSAGAHTHSITGTSANNSAAAAASAHNHTLALDLNYVNFILASKDA